MTCMTRAKALSLAVLTLLVMLFSDFFISSEQKHDCIGEHCPICAQIAVCENTLKNLSGGAASAVSVCPPISAILSPVGLFTRTTQTSTPVSLKVKLLN